MINNNLIQVLNTFSKKEMTRYREFAYSPYHNKHKKVQALISYLETIFPHFTAKNCDRKVIFGYLFPQESHQQSALAIVFTYAIRLMEDFLIQEQFKENEGFHNILLLRQLRSKEQYKQYEKILKTQDKLLKASKYRDSDYYNLSFLTATEEDQYHAQLSKHEENLSIQQKEDNLDLFFISEKLRNACEMATRSKILQVNYSVGLIQFIITAVREDLEKYQSTPPIILYYHIYQMIEQKEVAFYFQAIPILNEFEHYFPRAELQTIYNYFLHFCIEQINQGNAHFLRELFKLYQKQLEQELLIDNNNLSQWHYKNIATVGLRLNETEWVRDFIESYKVRLKQEAVDNAYTFNLASYYYTTQQYEKVLDLLLKVEYSDIRYSLGAKGLLFRTYYVLDEYEALVSFAESFKQYLLRNKTISDYRRKGYNNLIRFTKRAFQIKSNLKIRNQEKSKKDLDKLIKDIDQAETIFNKSWLDKKIQELTTSI